MSIKNYPKQTYGPTDVDFNDMDHRSDWAETDTQDPAFIRNKPADSWMPAKPTQGGYKLVISATGEASWVAVTDEVTGLPTKPTADGSYKLVVSSGVATWTAITE